MYDYLVVGSGLYGAVFVHKAKKYGKTVPMVEKCPQVAGIVHTENVEGINVHRFHPNNRKVWQCTPDEATAHDLCDKGLRS